MASSEKLKKTCKSTKINATSQSPADKLAAMRPQKPIPPRVLTYTKNSNNLSGGRIVTEKCVPFIKKTSQDNNN